MIDWLATADLRRCLQGFPPIGLWLRDWFHARTEVDPRSTLPTPSEPGFDEGIGEVHAWSGRVGGVPFAIRSMTNRLGGYGFEILLPVRARGDLEHLDALRQLRPLLPGWRSPYFDQLPIGAGFGVVGGGHDSPIYVSASRDNAAAVAAFLSPALFVVPVNPGTPRWIIIGPQTDRFISRVETTSTEDEARRLAARWAADTGATFDVRTHL